MAEKFMHFIDRETRQRHKTLDKKKTVTTNGKNKHMGR